MYNCILYVRKGMGHLRIKVDIPEDSNFPHLIGIEILPTIEHLLQMRQNIWDGLRILLTPAEILDQYIADRMGEKEIEDFLKQQG